MENRLFNEVQYNYNLKDFLSNMTKDELNEIRRTLKIKGISKLKKDQLIVELENFIIDNLNNIITEELGKEEIQCIKQILDKDGVLDYRDELINMLIKCRNAGIMFSGSIENSRKVVLIPEDLKFPMKEIIMTNAEHEQCKDNNEWINITKALLNYYGVLTIEDVYKMFIEVCGKKIDFYDYIVQAISVDNEFYSYNKEDKIVYLKDVEKPLYMLHQQRLKLFPYFQVTAEMINKINKECISATEKAMYEMFIKDYGMDEDTAEKNVKICMKKIRNGYSLKDVAEKIFSSINFKNIEQANEFIERITYIYNNTRIWCLKGYTYSEVKYIERGNGKTIVKGNKIGRNEPCPCGSGKKYKKCCGK